MYPSGLWEGFWVQEQLGRQQMREFQLLFHRGTINGGGIDVVGRFHIAGAYDETNGLVLMVKKYVGKHAVRYRGEPDGEGSIQGNWEITTSDGTLSGPFLMRPKGLRHAGEDEIADLR